MLAAALWQILTGIVFIVGLFGLFALVMYRARRSHTKRYGGITIWQLLWGRWPRRRK